MLLELNASDDRGINIIRDKIKSFAKIKSIYCPYFPKLIFLDEADALTEDAQFALRRVIEKYTQNVRFCLVCNYINKLIPALCSRCLFFKFYPIKDDILCTYLHDICNYESLSLSDNIIQTIITFSDKDFRKCINSLYFIKSIYTDLPICELENIIYHHFTGLYKLDYQMLHNILNDLTKSNIILIKELFTNLQKYVTIQNLLTCISKLIIKLRKYKLCSHFSTIEYNFYKSKQGMCDLYLQHIEIVLIDLCL